MNLRTRTGALAALLVAGVAAATPLPVRATEPVATPAPLAAVWVEHQFNFTYMAIGTYYSCDGLASKVSHLLRRLGARDDTRVRQNCPGGTGVDPLAGVRITAYMPAEATPERLAPPVATARDELIARVQGQEAGVDAAPAPFQAVWKTVEIDGRRDRQIDDGDCELLQQLYPQVLAKMGVRMLPDSRLRCSPRMSQDGAVRLRLESLQKLPTPDAPPAAP
jgi:hypothetical protein